MTQDREASEGAMATLWSGGVNVGISKFDYKIVISVKNPELIL